MIIIIPFYVIFTCFDRFQSCFCKKKIYFMIFFGRSSHQCRDLLDEARDYHLMPERRPLLNSFKSKPRKCKVRNLLNYQPFLKRSFSLIRVGLSFRNVQLSQLIQVCQNDIKLVMVIPVVVTRMFVRPFKTCRFFYFFKTTFS